MRAAPSESNRCMPGQLASSTGCSKRLSSKTAGEPKPEASPCGYVEDAFDKPRTQLAGFFNILSPWDDGFGSCHHLAVGADLGGGGLTA